MADDVASPAGPADIRVRLSVVVTIVDGGEVLRRLLRALTTQTDPPGLEILVPFDSSIGDTAGLAVEFPEVRFLALGPIGTDRPIGSAAGQHELYDRRRAAGLAAARGELVAIVEDRGVPRANWARAIDRLHADLPHVVIGGAIEAAPAGPVGWALYLADFGRYGLPFEAGAVRWVSDINVSYKRRALEATRPLWRDRFHEPIVHWALLDRGETLFLSPDAIVDHARRPAALGRLVVERFHWGRLYGAIRAARSSPADRVLRALAGPALPFVLFLRIGRAQVRKGRLVRYARAAPALLLFAAAWAAGETAALLTGRA